MPPRFMRTAIAGQPIKNGPETITDTETYFANWGNKVGNRYKHMDDLPEETTVGATTDTATGTNANAVVTYAAIANAQHRIDGVTWSFNATPATPAQLKIENGAGNTVFSIYITEGGAGYIPFEGGLYASENTAMIITLGAAGTGVRGDLSIVGHKVY